jgi:hypothetical protein
LFVGFAALAVLSGPIRAYTYSSFDFGGRWQTPPVYSLRAALAGVVLLVLGVARRERMLAGRQWVALVVLLLPQWLTVPLSPPYGRTIPGLHETRWGVALLLNLAAPLWLGLLAALEVIPVEVPRAVIGAGIAGIGAVCLMIPVDAYRVEPNQTPVLTMQLLLNILVVFTWAYARPRLVGAGTLAVAGSFLLLSATGNIGVGLLFRQDAWLPVGWREIAAPLVVEGAVSACLWCLWFWLLQRMPLAAFSMGTLAMWTATMLPGFALFGFLQWRMDAALLISLAAIVVALRARAEEEQPVALGIAGP